ncbi:MAG: hypothetical protein GY953_28340, partial [bacterium]|nr:hypothetical protein [bacterium]
MRALAKPLICLGAVALFLLAFGQSRVGAQVFRQAVEAIVRLAGLPLPASRGVLSEHEIEQIDRFPAQAQAERLLERAINHYQGAAELIEQRVDSWRGQLEYSDAIATLTYAAYNSSDLRVRAAAAEVSLAAYGLEKTPATVDDFIVALDQNRDNLPYRLWSLGLLGSRGVEPGRVF